MSVVDDAYRRSAEVVYEGLKELQGYSFRMQGEYGKWLIVSLLSLNSAAIGALLLKTGANMPIVSIWVFVVGILLALASGLAAFYNFYLLAKAYDEMADHRMLSDRKHWPKTDYISERWVSFTFNASVVAGLASAACLPLGAFFAASALAATG